MSKTRAVIEGIGGFLPERVVTNDELATFVDTSDEWIRERSGIEQRHFTSDTEYTSTLSVEAAKMAMARAGVTADDIDLVLLGTTTPDLTFPCTATLIQNELGIKKGAAFDIHAACSSFIYALSVANNFVLSGQHSKALVIGGESLSKLLDFDDRSMAVLFGDGAGAVVLGKGTGDGSNNDRGVLSTYIRSDGEFHDILTATGGPGLTRDIGKPYMNGREVFKHAVHNISTAMQTSLDEVGLTIDDVDWVVPHQANKRILDGVAKRMRLPSEKVILTVQDHGNTSAASCPLALNVAYTDGRIKENDLVLFGAMGAGLTWGSALVRI